MSRSANVALINGPYRDIVEQSLRALVGAENTLVIDAADVVNETSIKKYAPELSLFDMNLVKPVTAFQLKWFVDEELSKWMDDGIETVVIFGLKPLFFDQNVLSCEYLELFRRVTADMKKITSELNRQVITLTFSEQFDCIRDSVLTSELESFADLVFNLSELEVCAVRKS